MIRDLAELLVTKPRARGFGLAARLTIPLTLIVLSIIVAVVRKESSTIFYASSLVFTSGLLAYNSGLTRLLKGVQLILLFILLGLFINIVALAAGLTPLSLEKVLTGALRLSAIAFAAILLFQWVGIEEWVYLFSSAGAEGFARILALSMIQLPLTLRAFSEALLSVRLKYGGKYFTRILNPLLLHAMNTARSASETLLIYGPPAPVKTRMWRERDILLYAGLSAIALSLLV
uniref:Energy-coupling factor transporter transmembrane protein EcfT n=1 Tax=Thermosphaera aggregans TaxID=54254 RepID=A0A7C2BKE2_9CREN